MRGILQKYKQLKQANKFKHITRNAYRLSWVFSNFFKQIQNQQKAGIQYGEANLTLTKKYAFTKKFTILTQSL